MIYKTILLVWIVPHFHTAFLSRIHVGYVTVFPARVVTALSIGFGGDGGYDGLLSCVFYAVATDSAVMC